MHLKRLERELIENRYKSTGVIDNKLGLELIKRIEFLNTQLASANQRIELLEHDMKSGDYESLYALRLEELEDAKERIDQLEKEQWYG